MKHQSKMPEGRETTGEFWASLDITAMFGVKETGSKAEACLILSWLIWSEWLRQHMEKDTIQYNKALDCFCLSVTGDLY